MIINSHHDRVGEIATLSIKRVRRVSKIIAFLKSKIADLPVGIAMSVTRAAPAETKKHAVKPSRGLSMPDHRRKPSVKRREKSEAQANGATVR